MALVGLSEAAKLTGRNQTTIHRAMKAGRLSCTVDETGSRRIETAELDRVFGIKERSDDGRKPAADWNIVGLDDRNTAKHAGLLDRR
jgi:hypothetical protein